MITEAPSQTTTPTTDEIKSFIVGVFRANPAPHTHAQMHRKLSWLTDCHRIAMVMNALVIDGVLEHDGAVEAHLKRYTYHAPFDWLDAG